MSLINNWKESIENLTNNDEYNEFWNVYLPKEESNYEYILNNPEEVITGTVKDLAERFSMDLTTFTGFLDGINESLNSKLDLDSITEESDIALDVNLESLYYNMLDAKADWLYSLPQWDELLTDKVKKELSKKFNATKIFVNEDNKVKRNDPCPCGSGKKYKKCCLNK